MAVDINSKEFRESLELDLLRNVCRDSLYRFVQEFWPIVVPQKPVWNWHIAYLCQKLQAMFDDVINNRPKKYDLIINLPPGSSKSTIFSILFPAWVWCKMPECRFITASFNQSLAEEFALKSKMVMKSDLYKQCFGELRFFPERAGHFMNQYKGDRIVCTTSTSPTGHHAHFILIDDPVDPLNTDREVAIHNVNTWMQRVIRTRVIDASISPFMLIMQRLSVDDPTGAWLEKVEQADTGSKVYHISLPASLENGQQVKPAGLRRYYRDKLFDPKRLPMTVLEDRKLWMTAQDYAAQYDQNPLPKEGLMFKVQKMLVKPLGEMDPIVARVRYWDKAISTREDACYTVGVLMGRTATGKFVVMDVRRGQWDATTRENIILNTARADGPKVVVGIEQEPGPIWDEEMVLLSNGDLRAIKDIKVGDEVINRYGEPTKVTNVERQGEMPCCSIMSEGGASVIAANIHPFITPYGTKMADDLHLEDEIFRYEGGEIVDDSVVQVIKGLSFPCTCLTVEEGASFIVNDLVVHNSGGIESALYTVRNLAGFKVYVDKAISAKEARAEPFAIQVDNGNVSLLEGNWNTPYLSEIGSFPRGRYKDQVDASSGAFRMLCGFGRKVAGAL